MNLEDRIKRARVVYATMRATERSITIPNRDGSGPRPIAELGDAWEVHPQLLSPWSDVVRESIERAGPQAAPVALLETLIVRLATHGVIWRTGDRVVSCAESLALPAGHPMGTSPGTVVDTPKGRPAPPLGGYYVRFDKLSGPMAVMGDCLAAYVPSKKSKRNRLQAVESAL